LKNITLLVLLLSNLEIFVIVPYFGRMYLPKLLFLLALEDDLDLISDPLKISLLKILGRANFLYLCAELNNFNGHCPKKLI